MLRPIVSSLYTQSFKYLSYARAFSAEASSGDKMTGTVKWFNYRKGFGFIGKRQVNISLLKFFKKI